MTTWEAKCQTKITVTQKIIIILIEKKEIIK